MTVLLLPNNTPSHFTIAEAMDPTTGKYSFSDGHLISVETLRLAYDHPMIVTSWCRSNETTRDLLNRGYQASLDSFHLMKNKKYGTATCALDVARPNGPDLRELISCAISLGWSVGLAKTFVHLDQRAKFTKLPATFYSY